MMPDEIKAIVRKLLDTKFETNLHGYPLSWSATADRCEGDFDTLFEWLKQEAEKPSTGQLAASAARKVLD